MAIIVGTCLVDLAVDAMQPLLDLDPRGAIRDESILCLICRQAFRQLTNTHLKRHGVTAEQYTRRFGYKARRALMCHALRRCTKGEPSAPGWRPGSGSGRSWSVRSSGPAAGPGPWRARSG